MPRHDSSVLMLVNVVRAIIILILISFSDLPSSVIKLAIYIYECRYVCVCVTLTLPILTITQRHGVVTTMLVASAVCG